jgi:TRAP-type C4-dicarboxylate transport system substrate-binding protein
MLAALLSLGLGLSACGGSGTNKAGGDESSQPVVLTLANTSGTVHGQLDVFADEVARLSDGTLRIEFATEWRHGDPNAEPGTIEDVKEGKVDMAWVGARVFDTLGVRSFQPLLAPLLVDSYDLQARVFEEGIPEQMLPGVEELGVVGIGVLPGPMRKVLGVSHPFLGPSDFAGQVIGGADNELTRMTFHALGAEVQGVPAGGSLEGLDGLEQQLDSIWGNRYNKGTRAVTANLNLWPRPLVILADKDVFESLTPDQQAVLREAATVAIPGALEASRAEDEEAARNLCRRGLPFVTASAEDLAELRSALEPVYEQIAADPDAETALDAISGLKSQVAAAAESPLVCSADSSSVASGLIPDGTYEMTMTREEALRGGAELEAEYDITLFRVTFDGGDVDIVEFLGGPGGQAESGGHWTYSTYRDRVEITALDSGYTITGRWSFDGSALTFTEVEPADDAAIWALHPWVRTDVGSGSQPAEAKPIPDGRYETTLTKADWLNAGLSEEEASQWSTGLHTMIFEGDQLTILEPNGEPGFEASYTVFRDQITAQDAVDTITARWSLEGDTLTFTDVRGGGFPFVVTWTSHPWVAAK